MNSIFWMALSAVAGAAAVGITLAVHLLRYAYQRGQLDTRVAELERQQARTADTAMAIGKLEGVCAALKASIDKLDEYLDRRMGAIEARLDSTAPPRRRAAAG